MILIGRYLSPFVRRVGATLIYQGIEFEHRPIRAAGDDQDIIRQSNPLGRVPALILDNGETLSDSAVILDYIDDLVGEEKALMPRSGWDRTVTMNLLGIATGAAEKTVTLFGEKHDTIQIGTKSKWPSDEQHKQQKHLRPTQTTTQAFPHSSFNEIGSPSAN